VKQKLTVVLGPTASGKTSLGIELARRLNGEIISCDSMQIYDEIYIGTARPLADEQEGITHHLMGFVKPNASYSVADYQRDACAAIENIVSRGKHPILLGGTGLYANSITYDLDFTSAAANEELRAQLSVEYNEMGAEAFFEKLCAMDESARTRLHPNDKKRLIRRMEILMSGDSGEYDFYRESTKFDLDIYAIDMPRELLYERVNKRVEIMFDMGLEAEVRALYDKYGADIQAFTAIGYKEFIPYFKGEITIEQVKNTIAMSTRRFAKRQLTWFRRDERIKWLTAEQIIEEAVNKWNCMKN